MQKKTFKPQLAPNQQPDLEDLNYPLLVSYKMDGIRCIIKEGEILSRSLKPIQNKQLKEKLEPLRKYSEVNGLIIDGEIFSPNLTFQEIVSFVMTQDFEDKKSVKKFGKVMQIPDHLKFYCFDCISNNDYEISFEDRFINAGLVVDQFPLIAELIEHKLVNNKSEVEEYFNKALENGYEGLILRNPESKYKYGRGSLKEGIIYKLKPYKEIDGIVTGVIQSTEVDPNAEKKTNELGYSTTSKKKNDRIAIEKASAFYVNYQGKELKVVLAMTDKGKEDIWRNKEAYIGKCIEYKYLEIGMKDGGLPRHPIFLRFRKDKDEL